MYTQNGIAKDIYYRCNCENGDLLQILGAFSSSLVKRAHKLMETDPLWALLLGRVRQTNIEQ